MCSRFSPEKRPKQIRNQRLARWIRKVAKRRLLSLMKEVLKRKRRNRMALRQTLRSQRSGR